MVRIEDFHVEFEKRFAVYQPGERLTGKTVVRLGDDVKCDSVQAQFFGSTRVFWVEREASPHGFRSLTYSTERVYFNIKEVLWRHSDAAPTKAALSPDDEKGPGEDKELGLRKELGLSKGLGFGKGLGADTTTVLNKGSHEFPFSFALPEELPTSFDAQHSVGYVRYFVKICLMSGETIRHSRKSYFTVVKTDDLNLIPTAGLPAAQQMTRGFARGCFSKTDKSISIGATLEKSGFVPGERLRFQAHVVNASGKSVKMLKASLKQYVTCYAEAPEFKLREAMALTAAVGSHDKIRPGASAQWDGEALFVPAVVPTFGVTDAIEVRYGFVLEAFFEKKWPCVAVEIPVIVGTIPVVVGLGRGHGALPPPYNFSATPQSPYGVPPPSYEESVLGRTQGQDGQEENYLPRYATYNFR